MSRGLLHPERLVTHRLAFRDAARAFDLLENHPRTCCNVLLDFGAGGWAWRPRRPAIRSGPWPASPRAPSRPRGPAAPTPPPERSAPPGADGHAGTTHARLGPRAPLRGPAAEGPDAGAGRALGPEGHGLDARVGRPLSAGPLARGESARPRVRARGEARCGRG